HADGQSLARVRAAPGLVFQAPGPLRGGTAPELGVGERLPRPSHPAAHPVVVAEARVEVGVDGGAQELPPEIPVHPLVGVDEEVAEDAEGVPELVVGPAELVDLVRRAHEAQVVDLEAGRAPGHAGLEADPAGAGGPAEAEGARMAG